MDKRISLILNGRQEIKAVISNLYKLFEGEDKVLFYTKSEKSEFETAIKEVLNVDDEFIKNNVSFDKFNEVKYEKVKVDGAKKIIGIKMPNSLFHNIAKAYNDAFKYVDNTEVAEYIHAFTDDCKIVEPSRYDPSIYEWFMDNFDEPFVMDSKTNPGNFAFKKYSPRFVFISKNNLKSPISFVQFESKEHFVINRSKLKEDFDDKMHRLYISEYIIRLHEKGVVRHPTFYPDPVIETWVKRDTELPYNKDVSTLQKEYSSDEQYIQEILKKTIKIENSVDPIIKELSTVIETKLKGVA